ncbi:YncE family protein [Candidatus Poribacteria bacterium]
MYWFKNQFVTGLLSFLLIFTLIGCGEDEEEDEELLVASGTVYIVNGAAETISVFEPETSEMNNDVVPVGKWPNDIKIAGSKVYVVNTGDNNVQIMDLALTEIDMIDIGEGTGPEKIDFVGYKAYVSCFNINSVNVVDLASGQVTKSIEVGTAPWGVAAAGGKVYVCNSNAVFDAAAGATAYGDGTVSVIDSATDEVIATIDVDLNPTEIAVSGGNVIVMCTGNYDDITGKLTVIDPASDTVAQVIDLGAAPSGLAVSPNGKAYMTIFDGLISVDIGSGTVAGPLEDFGNGFGLAFDGDGNGYISVPDWVGTGDDKLLVMDASEALIGTYVPGGGASIVAVKE